MKTWLVPIAFSLLIGCQNQADVNTLEETKGLEHTNADKDQSPDELLLESRREVTFTDDELQIREAENLLSSYLRVNEEDTVVQYDHKEKGKYILRVYSLNENQDVPHEWYSIDIHTKQIEKLIR
ncbi:hypothetical protein [Bacillus sp. FJAT-47783]|uniref:hypothetical protein n=1 Tax=Bacillus sp. FJAT-47783 TaxID=2922712 RepID=UPI001FACDC38|nr:hypothetical protein [Bacillus sp. FJAT-47783]